MRASQRGNALFRAGVQPLRQPRAPTTRQSKIPNRAPSNNDDKTTTLPLIPPREFVHAPGAPAARPTSQRDAPTRAGSPHAPEGGWGAHGGGLGWDQGARVFGGVVVGCVGRNTVLLDLILSLGVRRRHTPVFLNTPPMLFLLPPIRPHGASLPPGGGLVGHPRLRLLRPHVPLPLHAPLARVPLA